MFVKKFNYGQNRSIKGVHKLMGQKTKESFFTKDKTHRHGKDYRLSDICPGGKSVPAV